MRLNQVRFSVLLLFAVQLSTAQWYGSLQIPARFQLKKPGQALLQTNAGLPSQWMQSGSQVGIPALGSVEEEFNIPLPLLTTVQPVPCKNATVEQVKILTWRFPTPPQLPTPPAQYQWEAPASAPSPSQSISVQCNETAVYILVRRDLFFANPIFSSTDLSLGGCAATGVDDASQALIFESELQDCNSELTVSGSELVYTFTLGISAVPLSGTSILRGAGTNVSIECHYPRFFNVSSNALMPAWISFSSALAAEEELIFSLNLMTDDWTSQRLSYHYYLGEFINIEASVLQFKHVPLRVLVDSCVATPVPDINAVPRYSFIDNYGCLIDAKLTYSSSHFMPQTQANKLGFQLESFLFQEMNNSEVYIACILKATAASAPPDAENKACSFSDNGWIAAYGPDQVCSCCDSSCASRKKRDQSSDQGFWVKEEITIGPIVVTENAYD